MQIAHQSTKHTATVSGTTQQRTGEDTGNSEQVGNTVADTTESTHKETLS